MSRPNLKHNQEEFYSILCQNINTVKGAIGELTKEENQIKKIDIEIKSLFGPILRYPNSRLDVLEMMLCEFLRSIKINEMNIKANIKERERNMSEKRKRYLDYLKKTN
jgi:hypothetical protein